VATRIVVPVRRFVGHAADTERAAAATAGLTCAVTALTVADAATPDGDATWIRTPLLGLTDIGKLIGVSRQRAGQLAAEHPLFPPAVARAGVGPLYEEVAILAFQVGVQAGR